MVGQIHVRRRYRYYRCRRSYTGYFGGKCDSKHVSVDLLERLERIVLEQIFQLLADPHRILAEAWQLKEDESDTAHQEAVKRKLEQVEDQQRRMARLYVTGYIPEKLLESQREQLKQQRIRLESERRALKASAPKGMDLGHLEEKLPEACARLKQWVLGASDQDTELILLALAVQVRASNREVHIEGLVPLLLPKEEDLVTIGQTLG